MPSVHSPVAIVLAAGHDGRMKSRLPKLLQPICGRPMAVWPVHAALAAGAQRVVVVGGPDMALVTHLPERATLATQAYARGTGDAVRCAAEHIDPERPVVIVPGDVPLITGGTIAQLVRAHDASRAAATLLTMRLADPGGYGRVVRDEDGGIVGVAETRRPGGASLTELAIREVSTGVLCFDGAALLDGLALCPVELPDTLPFLRAAGYRVGAYEARDDAMSVDDQSDLSGARAVAQRRIAEAHMRAGVTIVDPSRTIIDAQVRIGAGTVIQPGTQLEGRTTIGAGCDVGPHTTVRDSVVGDGATVLHSVVAGTAVAARATVGPFEHVSAGGALRRPVGRAGRQAQRERGALTRAA